MVTLSYPSKADSRCIRLKTAQADGLFRSMLRRRLAGAFMITGPATKITNLGAVKIVLEIKRFALYLAFTVLFALATGWVVDLVI